MGLESIIGTVKFIEVDEFENYLTGCQSGFSFLLLHKKF